MQTTDPAKAVWPVVEEVEVGSAGEGVVAFVAEPSPPIRSSLPTTWTSSSAAWDRRRRCRPGLR